MINDNTPKNHDKGFMVQRHKELCEQSVVSETPPFPRIMLMEPTNVCNLRCAFCGNSKSDRAPVFLSLTVAETILRDAFSAGCREVGFYRTGEPLLHKSLPGLVNLAHMIGYEYIFLTTNGVYANMETVATLARNGLNSIKFSLNAPDAESYRRIHGADAYDMVRRNLADAITLRDREKATGGTLGRVMVTSVYTDEALETGLMRLRREYSDAVDDFWVGRAKSWVNMDTWPDWKCIDPYAQVNITAEGYLSACCNDMGNQLVVSTLADTPVHEAWNGEAFRAFRRRLIQRDLDGTMCGRCLYGCTTPVHPIIPDRAFGG